ncbi:MAG: succinate dehydrogenase/fumarate reductase iron-sulfur subunit [Myxococcales bacterium]|nr:succinate dehydrogenase/fumarate reductase iron-sulfur subunit [Myxococcales bacterium]MBK7194054.1 succinate dehydrogenase/fumarate reductase iron-sulfur subunit [Myxococcales bacterium]
MSDMNLTLHIWRQAKGTAAGAMKTYQVKGISEHASFLEMLDVLNEQLQEKGEEPVAFDSDCREGICGMCSLVINGRPHGPDAGTTTCQLHMRRFKNGDEIYVEPFRAGAFPVVRDLCVDRKAFDDIVAAGGYVTANVGSAPDANAVPIPKEQADRAFDAAACIGCGACVAACPNSSAMLFTAAKVAHLAHLPQGQPERLRRVKAMVTAMDAAGFGNCSNHYECEAACPKGISKDYIALMNRDYAKSVFVAKDAKAGSDGAG